MSTALSRCIRWSVATVALLVAYVATLHAGHDARELLGALVVTALAAGETGIVAVARRGRSE